MFVWWLTNVHTNDQITCDAEVVVSSVGGKAASMIAAFGNFAHYIWTFLIAMKQICQIYLEILKNIPPLADSGYFTLDYYIHSSPININGWLFRPVFTSE